MTKKEMAQFRKRRDRILALLAGGMSQAEVGRKLGLKRQRVNQIARAAA